MTPAAYIPGPSPTSFVPLTRGVGRASTLLLVMGILTLLLGGCLVIASYANDATFQTPDVERLMSQMHVESTDVLRYALRIMGGAFLVYSVAALALGLLVRLGTLLWLTLALILTTTVLLFVMASVFVSLIAGAGGDLVIPIILGVLHGTASYWLADAIRQRATQRRSNVVESYPPPMAAYYETVPPIAKQ